jgi:hypothetical protein
VRRHLRAGSSTTSTTTTPSPGVSIPSWRPSRSPTPPGGRDISSSGSASRPDRGNGSKDRRPTSCSWSM